ncbi:hypothetical protein [Enterovirga sp.]|jgi:tetratricopeptide (TPR) repeat protein|uniref:hypothetical protein n=1 Tax=Enterovirga sp. TaxID=2026350 RepID=UPI002629C850|nr:hypothetical protein [Enterovirga sp.]MDB5592377.1 Tetratricopeptide 2 repeat protein [Enterovirga sp.]
MIRHAAPLLALAVALAAPAASAQTRPPEGPRPGPEAPRTPASTLDDLFTRLADSKDEDEANGIAALIQRRFARSGSDTADLLMERAGTALKAQDAALAVELLDRVTQLKPDWAEAWSRRAAAFHGLDDPGQAMQDLQRALAREPRHFTAWVALGHLEFASGDKRRALLAYRQALRIHPHLGAVKGIVDRLAPDIEGRDL